MVAIHRRIAKDECFVVLLGKVGVTTHGDDGAVIGDVVLSQESGNYGIDIPKGVWHMVEALELGSVIFECNRGRLWSMRWKGYLMCSGNEEGIECLVAFRELYLCATVVTI